MYRRVAVVFASAVQTTRGQPPGPSYLRLQRMAMADRTSPASEKVAGSGASDVTAPRAKVTSSMKSAVLPAAKPIETDEISVCVDVNVTKLPLGTLPTLQLLEFVKLRLIVGLDA